MFKKQKIKSRSGITLVALVVTIVVLLLLAGVSLSLVIGNDGIMKRAKEAKERYGQASKNEQKDLDTIEDYMNKMTGEGSGTGTGKVTVGAKADKNSTINGEGASAKNPIIPEGYIPIDTTTTSWGDGTSAPTEDNVNKGLVITDSVDESGKSNGNEWVWVPVPDASVMYEIAETPITLSSLKHITDESVLDELQNVKISKYSKDSKFGDEIERNTSEPDIAVGKDGQSHDMIEENRAKAGFTTLVNMAETMKNEYEAMIASIEKYHGFYIGRYELSEDGIKQGKKTLSENRIGGSTIDWYDLYAKCKTLSASGNAMTRMIWGCQWDITCNFIANYGDKKNIVDDESWGNTGYWNDGFNNIENAPKLTGSNEAWKANNIYDLLGNYDEFSQEVYNFFNSTRTYRGGDYFYDTYYGPVTDRNHYGYADCSTRPTLIVID